VALSIEELRAFVASVDLGSVGRAAQALGVTQSALSKRIKSLELAAGSALLERTSTGVRPSAEGRAILEETRRLLAQADALELRMLARASAPRPVRIAASPALAEGVVPAAIATLEVGQSGLPIELLVANSSEVRRAVEEGRVDIGVAAMDYHADPGPAARLLGEDELVAAVPAGDPWADLPEVTLEQLSGRRLVLRDPASNARQLLEREVTKAGFELAPPILEVGNPAAVKAAVRAAKAPGVLSKYAIGARDEGIVARPIVGGDLRRRFWVLLAPGAAPGAAAVASGLLARPLP
jgi:DNA-binding transcriptional LysR family regulator